MTTLLETVLLLSFLFFVDCCHGSSVVPDAADYIVVGAGTGGSVLAARLCEKLPNASVLVLERGVPRTLEDEFNVRSMAQRIPIRPVINEFIPTQPEPALLNRRLLGLAGRTLGGSSSINGAQFTYPSTGQIGEMSIDGLTEERARQLLDTVTRRMNVGVPRSAVDETMATYLENAARAGFQTADPFQGTNKDEIWRARISADSTGRRNDAATAYLTPALISGCQNNLQLVLNATVHKVTVVEKRATGVVVQVDGVMHVVKANREVLVSAGPFYTPALLQLSGIGPRDVLEAAGVDVVHELPVGQELHGRAAVGMNANYTKVELAEDVASYNWRGPAEVARFVSGGGGSYFANLGFNGRVNDLGYIVGEVNQAGPPVQRLVRIVCVHGPDPKSRGHVNIRSADALAQPEVFFNLLSTPGDLERLVECVRAVRRVQVASRDALGTVDLEPFNDELFEAGNYDKLVAAVRATTNFGLHLVAGAPVGSVLTSQLQVKGIDGLRVVDSSAIPTMPRNAGPAGLVYIIAEHIVDAIAHANESCAT